MEPLKAVTPLDATRKAFSLYDEFKAFAFKGNVIDLAVGVIIGAAFARIIDSLVKNIIMPLVSLVLPSDQSYVGWKWVIDGKEVPYGLFVGEVVNFLIVALALFLFIIKFLVWIMRAKETEEVAPPPPTKDQALLAEIRDLLREKRGWTSELAGPGRTREHGLRIASAPDLSRCRAAGRSWDIPWSPGCRLAWRHAVQSG